MKKGIYIHIPFCRSKCRYCDFNSYSGKDELIDAYFDAIITELKGYSARFGDEIQTGTVFFGGGTPSYVDSAHIFDVLEIIYRDYCVTDNMEISLEANPGTVSKEKLTDYKLAGVNRLSFGVQAFQPHILEKLGRIHTKDDFIRSVDEACGMGFDNISADLMFGIAGQSIEDWKESVDGVVQMELPHISCYSLKVEEGTPLHEAVLIGEEAVCGDVLDREMYYYARSALAAAGLKHYEISNFAKPGYECLHNDIYWTQREYIGIGAGAHSYFNGCRFANVNDIEEYYRLINANDGTALSGGMDNMTENDEMLEYMMLGLRKTDGIKFADFRSKFHMDAETIYRDKIGSLQNRELIISDDAGIRLTDKGLDFANQVFMEFV